MARCKAPFFAKNPNSTTIPIAGLLGVAGQDFFVREIGVFADAATAVPVKLQSQVVSAGGTNAALTPKNIDFPNHTILGNPRTWTVAPTTTSTIDIAPMPTPAQIGGGTILTWYGDRNGLYVPAGTGNTLVLLQVAATNAAVSGYIIWDE